MNTKEWQIVRVFAQVGLGAIFFCAGVMKLRDGYASFHHDIGNFKLSWLQESWLEWLAYGLPWLEVLVGLCLCADFCRKGAACWSLLLSLAFCVAVASAWRQGIDLRCGCLGKSTESVNYPLKMLALMGMLAGSVVVVYFGAGQRRFFQIKVAD